MAKRFLLLSRFSWQGRNRLCAAKSLPIVCALLVLVVSDCGGGGSSVPPPEPLTVTEETLYSFGATPTDATTPSGMLIQGSDGNFYGTTYRGGLPNCDDGSSTKTSDVIGCGTVYKITPTGEETVLYLFAQAPGDATFPQVLIQGNDGNFYGTTSGGGAHGAGTVFKLTPEGIETILYSFKAGSDGAGGEGLLQGMDGNFYGTTDSGGANNAGTVFKLTPEGVETTLYSFSGNLDSDGGPSNASTDGAYPVGQVVEGSDGNFYGVTSQGGVIVRVSDEGYITHGGTVFQVTPAGVETVLHRFSGSDGESPNALIQGSDGNLYGTTSGGGVGIAGVVFKLTPEGVETTLYFFSATASADASDGAGPNGVTQGSDGNLYGTTSSGIRKDLEGTAFELTTAGGEAVIYSFPKFTNATFPDPFPSTNLVQGSDGNFYGATLYGGAHDEGYFFKLTVSSH
jgi:uncharacterized repeat protein (TIGR03803 family)